MKPITVAQITARLKNLYGMNDYFLLLTEKGILYLVDDKQAGLLYRAAVDDPEVIDICGDWRIPTTYQMAIHVTEPHSKVAYPVILDSPIEDIVKKLSLGSVFALHFMDKNTYTEINKLVVNPFNDPKFI